MAFCHHLAENDLLEAWFAASAQYCREGTVGGMEAVQQSTMDGCTAA